MIVGREGPGADDALCGDSVLVGLGLWIRAGDESKLWDPGVYERRRGAVSGAIVDE